MNDMKKIMMIGMVVALVALSTNAQTFGAQEPNVTFQSTSTMSGSGSAYSSNPTLNDDGTAVYNSASRGPRRAKKDDTPSTPGTPGSPSTPGQGSQENQFPLGDAAFPLLFLAGAYLIMRATRRRTSKGLSC